jgi:cyanate lyase
MGTTMANETIVIQTNDERIELTGKDLTDFLAQRAKDQAELDKAQALRDQEKAVKESAKAKLSALGLTEDEILAITGQVKSQQLNPVTPIS